MEQQSMLFIAPSKDSTTSTPWLVSGKLAPHDQVDDAESTDTGSSGSDVEARCCTSPSPTGTDSKSDCHTPARHARSAQTSGNLRFQRPAFAPTRCLRLPGQARPWRGTPLPAIPGTPATMSGSWGADDSSGSSEEDCEEAGTVHSYFAAATGTGEQAVHMASTSPPPPPLNPAPQSPAHLQPAVPSPPAWHSGASYMALALSLPPPMTPSFPALPASAPMCLPPPPQASATAPGTHFAPPGLEATSPREERRRATLARAKAEGLPLQARMPEGASKVLWPLMADDGETLLPSDSPAKKRLPFWPELAEELAAKEAWVVRSLDACEPAKKCPTPFLLQDPPSFCCPEPAWASEWNGGANKAVATVTLAAR
eukprot:gb/GFBE01052795.1/.p1 GENE.gb/GFBE01052795.1/~~gb/GFBE01052795.1/.p1  ORF type:complete len:370 (+),score=53.20 gb/GFBE01052795.1/:1-1110(+)